MQHLKQMPIVKGKKKAIDKGWTSDNYIPRKYDPNQYDTAYVLTDDVLVIDIDNKPGKEKGWIKFEQLQNDCGYNLLEICNFTQKSPTGNGLHLFFSKPKEIKVSKHKTQYGKSLEFLSKGHCVKKYTEPSSEPLAEAPIELLTILQKRITNPHQKAFKEKITQSTNLKKAVKKLHSLGLSSMGDQITEPDVYNACCIGVEYGIVKSIWFQEVFSILPHDTWDEEYVQLKIENAYMYAQNKTKYQMGGHISFGGKSKLTEGELIDLIRSDELLSTQIYYDELDQMKYWRSVNEISPNSGAGVPFYISEEIEYFQLYILKKYNVNVSGRLLHSVEGWFYINNRVDPLRDMIQGAKKLPNMYVKNLLRDYCGCTDDEYHQLLSEYLILALVARQLYQGVKCEIVPIIIGAQGVGKSTFCRALALEDKYFTDSVIDLKSTKDVVEVTRGKIIYESSELNAFARLNTCQLKYAVSCTVDYTRVSYAKEAKNYPRRFIMLGTCNVGREKILLESENRRFAPIYTKVPKGKKLDSVGLKARMLSYVAEARDKYTPEYFLSIIRKLEPLIQEKTKDLMNVQPIDELIVLKYFMDEEGNPSIPTEISQPEILGYLESQGGVEKNLRSRLPHHMNILGYSKKKQLMKNGVKAMYYLLTNEEFAFSYVEKLTQ